jgi:hypothetical protein
MKRTIYRKPLAVLAAVSLALTLSLSPGAPFGTHATAAGTTVAMTGQVVHADASSFHNWNDSGPPLGAVDFDLGLWQNGTATSGQTTLSYNVYTFQSDPVYGWRYVELEGGWGTIPSNSVQTSGGARPTRMTLTVDTSTLNGPGFWRIGSGGLISLTWSPVPGNTFTSAGSAQGSLGYVGHVTSWTSAGSYYNTSAASQGNLFGQSVPDPTADFHGGDLGSSQGVSLCQGCPPPPSP